MSKKSKIIVVIACIAVLAVGVLAFIFLGSNKREVVEQTEETTEKEAIKGTLGDPNRIVIEGTDGMLFRDAEPTPDDAAQKEGTKIDSTNADVKANDGISEAVVPEYMYDFPAFLEFEQSEFFDPSCAWAARKRYDGYEVSGGPVTSMVSITWSEGAADCYIMVFTPDETLATFGEEQ